MCLVVYRRIRKESQNKNRDWWNQKQNQNRRLQRLGIDQKNIYRATSSMNLRLTRIIDC